MAVAPEPPLETTCGECRIRQSGSAILIIALGPHHPSLFIALLSLPSGLRVGPMAATPTSLVMSSVESMEAHPILHRPSGQESVVDQRHVPYPRYRY